MTRRERTDTRRVMTLASGTNVHANLAADRAGVAHLSVVVAAGGASTCLEREADPRERAAGRSLREVVAEAMSLGLLGLCDVANLVRAEVHVGPVRQLALERGCVFATGVGRRALAEVMQRDATGVGKLAQRVVL